ncbi:hypothetical protein GCM10009809_20790 [Isoptericola hypogeus]|uniref:HTH marR-type domain-containing protein n=1 Tax=Isoptericola hypogeus TaxID=300179 RepID=A0ABP4VF53_9MICO
MEPSRSDLVTLDRALLALRRFLSAPRVLDDDGHQVELSTLLVLDELPAEGQTVRDVATRLGVAHSTASRFVSRAERAGMTARAASPSDGRQTLVVPTSAGLELAARAVAFRLDRLAGIVDDWAPGDVRALADGLARFARADGAR